ncbi:MAG: SUMF1/EgtB/PvdO family nonheme iron enzyme [Chloroflexi bacterium]|nr:SUMF1/EgtB/PvdO family nonheme iron enzyme [Chloroflexota bacterium]
MSRKLRVFLCHATEDRPAASELYQKLAAEPWIQPWMDTEDLLPGQDFDLEIYKALRDSDAILICMSQTSVSKSGYLNKEIRRTLDIADEKPEGSIYIIPVKFDDCIPSFERLKKYQWLEYFAPNAHEKLLKSLRLRAEVLKIETAVKQTPAPTPKTVIDDGLDLYRFIEIPPQPNSKVDYPFWIGKYPVTNAQYERFLNAPDYANPVYWLEFPKFDEKCQPMGDWGKAGVDWLREELKKANSKVLLPRYWDDKNVGKSNPNNPVVGVSWYEACAYAEWLCQNWERQPEARANPTLKPRSIRMPLESEWILAAGGDVPEDRYPWDELGQVTTSLKEVLRRANVREGEIGHTTSVDAYPLGRSSFGVMDMVGNVWEWQVNCQDRKTGWVRLRGGSWSDREGEVCVSICDTIHPLNRSFGLGFRVLALQGEIS